ncbi:MAG: type III secretion inner membrane ring lipoprotein SctJ [Deltaproteobacteria bacterium]|jgi:type III secretion protein J|nr:type III secretion inner membrane ring lipoprotein SctJ [Deltaproteobacteria bacterium]
MDVSFLKISTWACSLAALVFLTACQVEVYGGLNETEANLMLATLLERGVGTEKKSMGKNGFTVLVDEKDLVRSLEILRTNGLPQERYKTLGDVFSGQGMISSPVEEQARLSFAISQELADTFSKIDGVITARVHVVLGQHDQVSGQTNKPSAAIFLRHNQDSQVENMVAKIKEICATAVPGLEYEKVSVMLVPVRDDVLIPPPSAQAGLGERYSHIWTVAGLVILIAIASGLVLRKRGWLAFSPRRSDHKGHD